MGELLERDMADSATVVPSRQETEELFTLPPVPTNNPPFLLGASETIVIPAQPAPLSLGKKVAGYSAINFLAISDQGMTLIIEEANDPTGPFVQTGSFASEVMGTLQGICERFFPCGSYMRVTLSNTGGAQTVLSFKGVGLPMT